MTNALLDDEQKIFENVINENAKQFIGLCVSLKKLTIKNRKITFSNAFQKVLQYIS